MVVAIARTLFSVSILALYLSMTLAIQCDLTCDESTTGPPMQSFFDGDSPTRVWPHPLKVDTGDNGKTWLASSFKFKPTNPAVATALDDTLERYCDLIYSNLDCKGGRNKADGAPELKIITVWIKDLRSTETTFPMDESYELKILSSEASIVCEFPVLLCSIFSAHVFCLSFACACNSEPYPWRQAVPPPTTHSIHSCLS